MRCMAWGRRGVAWVWNSGSKMDEKVMKQNDEAVVWRWFNTPTVALTDEAVGVCDPVMCVCDSSFSKAKNKWRTTPIRTVKVFHAPRVAW